MRNQATSSALPLSPYPLPPPSPIPQQSRHHEQHQPTPMRGAREQQRKKKREKKGGRILVRRTKGGIVPPAGRCESQSLSYFRVCPPRHPCIQKPRSTILPPASGRTTHTPQVHVHPAEGLACCVFNCRFVVCRLCSLHFLAPVEPPHRAPSKINKKRNK